MSENSTPENDFLQRFMAAYSRFSSETLPKLSDLYADDVVFADPVHEMKGRNALIRYFEGTVKNLTRCVFEFESHSASKGSAYLTWVMRFEHPKIAGGKEISVPGSSMIHFSDKITYHRDYYDLGAMVYEHIPVLGWGVKGLKKKIAGG